LAQIIGCKGLWQPVRIDEQASNLANAQKVSEERVVSNMAYWRYSVFKIFEAA
jgi:hypothetical protein